MRDNEVSIRAVRAPTDHLIARVPCGIRRVDDDSSELRAEQHRDRSSERAGAATRIDGVEPAGAHGDAHLASFEIRRRMLLDQNDFGMSETTDDGDTAGC